MQSPQHLGHFQSLEAATSSDIFLYLFYVAQTSWAIKLFYKRSLGKHGKLTLQKFNLYLTHDWQILMPQWRFPMRFVHKNTRFVVLWQHWYKFNQQLKNHWINKLSRNTNKKFSKLQTHVVIASHNLTLKKMTTKEWEFSH